MRETRRAPHKRGGHSDRMCGSERRCRRCNDNLNVSPANACASKSAAMPSDERSRVSHRWAWQMGKGSEIARVCLGQAGAQQQLANNDVARAHPLLGKKRYQSRIPLTEMVYPGVRIDENHLL